MRSVLRTVDYLAYLRTLSDGLEPKAYDELAVEVERIARRFRDYRVPVTRLRGEAFPDVVKVFSRLNSSGMSLTAAELAAAESWAVEGEPGMPGGPDKS